MYQSNQQIKCIKISVRWIKNMGVESLAWNSNLFAFTCQIPFPNIINSIKLVFKNLLNEDNKTYFSGLFRRLSETLYKQIKKILFAVWHTEEMA